MGRHVGRAQNLAAHGVEMLALTVCQWRPESCLEPLELAMTQGRAPEIVGGLVSRRGALVHTIREIRGYDFVAQPPVRAVSRPRLEDVGSSCGVLG